MKRVKFMKREKIHGAIPLKRTIPIKKEMIIVKMIKMKTLMYRIM